MIGFVFISLAGIGSILWLTLNSVEVILCLGPLILILGGWVVSIIFYRVEMTSKETTAITLWKKQQIKWSEVEYIERKRFMWRDKSKKNRSN